MSTPGYVVLYTKKGDSTELFSEPMTYEGAEWWARRMVGRGDGEPVAIVTAEHAAERRAASPVTAPLEGAHLDVLLSDLVRRFQRDYPGVPQESALEVITLLCAMRLEGKVNLQGALLDRIHSATPGAAIDWRTHMLMAISNRRPEGSP